MVLITVDVLQTALLFPSAEMVSSSLVNFAMPEALMVHTILVATRIVSCVDTVVTMAGN
jgi:hypothetical protein